MTAFKRAVSAVAAIALIFGASVVTAPAAHAAARVTVANSEGAAAADPDYATNVTVRGSGFQSITKGFGGVYVLFGWVDDSSGGSWRPSQGGLVGGDFQYVPDSEAIDNQGFMRFVAFPGSDTEAAAHTVMAEDGSWTVDMVIPGAVFQSKDRTGSIANVDCRNVTCGIITIGGHGVKNANNETFTPISFTAPGSTGGSTGGSSSGDAQAAAPGEVRVGLAAAAVRAGASIVFTGQGFIPGEQVVAALDDGVTAIGPLTAGARGEVAGALPVPRDARSGTHLVTLTGAASGAVAQSEVMVEADPLAAAAIEEGQQVPQWVVLVVLAAIVIALVLVVASVITSLRRAAARRAARKAAAAASADTPPLKPVQQAEKLPATAADSELPATRALTTPSASAENSPTEVLTVTGPPR